MAYRRRNAKSPRGSTFIDDYETSSSSPSLAAQAIRASSAHRDSSLSSAYSESAYRESNRPPFSPSKTESKPYEYTSIRSLDESKHGFWSVLARKAKSILENDNLVQQFETPGSPQKFESSTAYQFPQSYRSPESSRKSESPKIQKGLDAITSSLNYIGGTIGKSLEGSLTIVENRTADIISETRKLQIRRKGSTSDKQNQPLDTTIQQPLSQIQTDHETQLKASRDVAMATAAKTKLLMRELKTVKADLAFAKQRCSQLEKENKILKESRDKGDSPEDDELIRLQLETLLAEKARLAHENSIYTSENRFLMEIIEYHQLTMQDVVYLDEGIEEVTEVYPISRTSSLAEASLIPPPPSPPPPPPILVLPTIPTPAGSLLIPEDKHHKQLQHPSASST